MITRHSAQFGGPNYRVLVLNHAGASSAGLAAALAELKANGVSVDETVVLDVATLSALPVLLRGAIRLRAYDLFVVLGTVDPASPETASLSTQQIESKLMDVALVRATPLGAALFLNTTAGDIAEKLARNAVRCALEIANGIDSVDEL